MDFFTHLVFGALMYILFLKDVTFDFILYAMFFAILPDLDIFITPLKRVFKSNYLEHRSGSHSYVIGVLISAIVGIIYSLETQQSFFVVWIIGSIFYGIHVSLDLLTTTKIPCFYPVSKKEYCFYVEKAGSSFTMLTSWVFIFSLLIIYNHFPNFFLLVLTINIYTYFIVFYYLFRIFTKVWVNSHLTENQKYFPGVLPFYFVVFEKAIVNNNISLQIEKKSLFSNPKIVFKNNSNLSSKEMELFKKGMDLCMKDYYYAKWNVMPIFHRKEGVFSIRFFFLEPMVKARAMYIQYNFDISTQKTLDYKQSFGRIQNF